MANPEGNRDRRIERDAERKKEMHAPPEGDDDMKTEEEVGRGVDGTGAAGTGGTAAKNEGTGSSTGTDR